MNKLHKLGLVAVVVIALVGAYQFPRVKEIVREVPVVGALSGPEVSSPYLSVDGVRHEYRKSKLATATTTVCALKSPSATSTLLSATVQVNTASSTATTWTFAKANTGFATTTALRNAISLGSGQLGTMVHLASTTLVAIDSVDVFSPNQFFVVGVAGTQPADATKLNGVCQAEFLVTS